MRRINWYFIAAMVAIFYFDVWLVLYVLAPTLVRIADWWVRR